MLSLLVDQQPQHIFISYKIKWTKDFRRNFHFNRNFQGNHFY